jgi:hypothetical protein
MDALSASLICQREYWDLWHLIFEWSVIIGVVLEVSETVHDLSKKQGTWIQLPDPAQHETPGTQLYVPAEKPPWQKWLSFVGWGILCAGLIGELAASAKLRDVDRLFENHRLSLIESTPPQSTPR